MTARYSASVASTRSIAASSRTPVRSRRSPSRVTFVRRSSSISVPSRATSATSRRVEFVPMSTTATRMCAQLRVTPAAPGRASACRRARRAGCRRRGRPCAARAVVVAEPMWGTTSRLGASRSGWSGGSGSGSVTSRPAPPRRPSCRAAASASWSTIGPRAVLTRIAVGFMRASASASMRCPVSGVSGVCTETKSARSSAAWRSSPRSTISTSISKPAARWATARPMRPAPTTARVAPWTSTPTQPCGSHVRHRRRRRPGGPRRCGARRRA